MKVNRNKSLLLILFVCLFLGSCASSLVFSPFMSAPSQPLKKDENTVSGGIGLFPETSPKNVERTSRFGGEIFARHGFSDRFTLQLKGWLDPASYVNDESDKRWGISASGIYYFLNMDNKYKLALIPQAALLYDGMRNDGQGFALSVNMWFPNSYVFYPYFSAGWVYGTKDFVKGYYGNGVMLNAGSAVKLSEKVEINAELVIIGYRIVYEKQWGNAIVPGLSLNLKL